MKIINIHRISIIMLHTVATWLCTLVSWWSLESYCWSADRNNNIVSIYSQVWPSFVPPLFSSQRCRVPYLCWWRELTNGKRIEKNLQAHLPFPFMPFMTTLSFGRRAELKTPCYSTRQLLNEWVKRRKVFWIYWRMQEFHWQWHQGWNVLVTLMLTGLQYNSILVPY